MIPLNAPLVVGVGGSMRTPSRSLLALERALAVVRANGGRASLLDLRELDLPMFTPGARRPHAGLTRLAEAVGAADALVVCSPVYQDCLSGAVKNALDHLHDLGAGPLALTGKAAGVMAVAAGGDATLCLAALHTAVRSLGASVARARVAVTGAALDENGVLYDPLPDQRIEAMVLELLAAATPAAA